MLASITLLGKNIVESISNGVEIVEVSEESSVVIVEVDGERVEKSRRVCDVEES